MRILISVVTLKQNVFSHTRTEARIGRRGSIRQTTRNSFFLTHTHIDHSKDLAYICQRKEGTTVYCPEAAVAYIDKWVKAEIDLNNCSEWDTKRMAFYPYKLIPVKGGSQFFFGKSENYKVTVLDCIHAVPCVGFCVSEKKSKLKEEYKSLPGKEIADLRKKKCGSF